MLIQNRRRSSQSLGAYQPSVKHKRHKAPRENEFNGKTRSPSMQCAIQKYWWTHFCLQNPLNSSSHTNNHAHTSNTSRQLANFFDGHVRAGGRTCLPPGIRLYPCTHALVRWWSCFITKMRKQNHGASVASIYSHPNMLASTVIISSIHQLWSVSNVIVRFVQTVGQDDKLQQQQNQMVSSCFLT